MVWPSRQLWASLYAAYEGLSAPLGDLCDGLSALRDAWPHKRPDRVAVHPVVRVHPETGRKAPYVNEHFTRRIVEMHPAIRTDRVSAATRHDRQMYRYLKAREEREEQADPA